MLVFNKTVFLLESGLGLDPWLLYPSPKGTHSPGCPCLPTGSSAPAHGPESHIISLCPEMLQKGKAPAPHSPAYVPEATKHSPPLLHKALPASPFLHASALPAPSTGGTEICMPGHGAVCSQEQTFRIDINSGTKLSLDPALPSVLLQGSTISW